jgi:hypothetical protein
MQDPSVRLIRELKEEITRLKAMLGGGLVRLCIFSRRLTCMCFN